MYNLLGISTILTTANFNTGFPVYTNDVIIHLSQWQFWFWFWFSIFWTLFFFLLIKILSNQTIKFHTVLNTSLRGHGKWGDFVAGLLPLIWCSGILINSNFILRMIEWQHESTLYTVRIHGRQWYWIYKIDLRALLDTTALKKKVGRGNVILFHSYNNNTMYKSISFLYNFFFLKNSDNYWINAENKFITSYTNTIDYINFDTEYTAVKKSNIKTFDFLYKYCKFLYPIIFYNTKNNKNSINNKIDNITNLVYDDTWNIKSSLRRTNTNIPVSINIVRNNSSNNVLIATTNKTVLTSFIKNPKVKPNLYLTENFKINWGTFIFNARIFNYLNDNCLKYSNFFYLQNHKYQVLVPHISDEVWHEDYNNNFCLRVESEPYINIRKTTNYYSDIYGVFNNNTLNDIITLNNYVNNPHIPVVPSVLDMSFNDTYKYLYNSKILLDYDYNFYWNNYNIKNKLNKNLFYIKYDVYKNSIYKKLFNFSKIIKNTTDFSKSFNLVVNILQNYLRTQPVNNIGVNDIFTRFLLYESIRQNTNSNSFKLINVHIKDTIHTNASLFTKLIDDRLLYIIKQKRAKKLQKIEKKIYYINNVLLHKKNYNSIFNFKINLNADNRLKIKSASQFYNNLYSLDNKDNNINFNAKLFKNLMRHIKHNNKIRDLLVQTEKNSFFNTYYINRYIGGVQGMLHNYNLKKIQVRQNSVFTFSLSKRLLKTRRVILFPVNVNIALITNSYDVAHSWFLPALGLKFDCVPGRATHHTINLTHIGVYYGQCAEICGRYHHHMPIKVCAVAYEQFIVWWKMRGVSALTKVANINFMENYNLLKYYYINII